MRFSQLHFHTMNNPTARFALAMASWILKGKLPSVLTPLIFEYIYKESDFAKEVASLIQGFRTCYEPSIEAFLFQSTPSLLESLFGLTSAAPETLIGQVMKVVLTDGKFCGELNGRYWYGLFVHAEGYNRHQREIISTAMMRKTWSPNIVPEFKTVEDQCLAALVAARSYDYTRFNRALHLFYDLKNKAPLVTLIVGMLGNERNCKMLPFGFIRDPYIIRLVSKTVSLLKDRQVSLRFVEYLDDPRGPREYRSGHVELKRHREAFEKIQADEESGFRLKRRRDF